MADEEVVGGAVQGAAAGSIAGPPGALAGAAVGLIGGLIGSSAKKRAARALQRAAEANMRAWQGLKVPSIEEQQIILQTPDLMGQYTPEQLQAMELSVSAMQSVEGDPEAVAAQKAALENISQVAEGGFTEGDKAASREVQRMVSQDAQARQKAILNSMAQRGVLGSGMELAAQLQGQQQSVDQMSKAGDNLIQQAQSRALQAMGQQGDLASRIRQQSFGEQEAKARAADEIERFNTQNRQAIAQANLNERNRAQMYNLGAQQERENLRAELSNKQQMYNKGLQQTKFSNELDKIRGVTGSRSAAGEATAAANLSRAQQQQNLFGSAVGGAMQGYKYPVKAATGGLITEDGVISNPELLNQFSKQTDLNNILQQENTTPSQETISSVNNKPEELDPRYKTAMDESRRTEAQANLLNTFLSAMEGTGTGYKANRSAVDALKSYAKQPLEDYNQLLAQEKQKSLSKKEAIDMEKSQLELDKFKNDQNVQADLNKPGSSVSLNMAEMYIAGLKKLGLNVDEDSIRGMSANQIKTLPMSADAYKLAMEKEYNDKKLANEQLIANKRLEAELDDKKLMREMEERRIGKEARQEKEGERRFRQNQINTARGMIKDDPRFKKAMEQSMAFDDVNELIGEAQKGNQQAVGALGTKLARAMGEVGVLTDTDVVRYVAGQSWGRKLKDWFTKGAVGELSPETIKGIQSNLKILKDKLDKDVTKVVDNSAARMKAAYPEMEDSDIRGILGFTTPVKTQQGPHGDIVERNGKKYKWNSTVGKYQLAN